MNSASVYTPEYPVNFFKPVPDAFLSRDFKLSELNGYLKNNLPNPLILIPPPPDEGSPAWESDMQFSRACLNAEKKRKEQAKKDAILRFPDATDAFNLVVGGIIHPEKTPSLYRILERTRFDGGLSTGSAKRFYRRPRPFMVNNAPSLTPWDEEILKLDGSYPSGHAAIGWIWTLILRDLFPSKSAAILKRGRQFGISRNICNVHWQSDVAAGRICGSAVKNRLYTSMEFLDDLSAAKKEINK